MRFSLLAISCVVAAAGCASQSKYERYESPYARGMGSDAASRMGSDAPSAARAPGVYWGQRGYLQTASDRRICDEIERRIQASTLSPRTKQIRCSCVAGRVLLTGPSANEDERDAVCHIAREVAGAHNVTENLEEPDK